MGAPAFKMPLASSPTPIIEEYEGFSYELLPEAEQDQPQYLKLRGLYQLADVKNRNGRVYPRSLWERHLAEGSQFRQRLENREVVGVLDHPDDGRTRVNRISHVMTNVWMEDGFVPGCPVCSAGGTTHAHIMGEELVLDTPEGELLQKLYRAGIRIATSSRGRGTVQNANGIKLVGEDFVPDCWDHVLKPSTLGAYPQVVAESVVDAVGNLIDPNCEEQKLTTYRRILSEIAESEVEDGKIKTDALRLVEAIDAKLASPVCTNTGNSGGFDSVPAVWSVPEKFINETTSTTSDTSTGALVAQKTSQEEGNMELNLSDPKLREFVEAHVRQATRALTEQVERLSGEADTLREEKVKVESKLEAAVKTGAEVTRRLSGAEWQLEQLREHKETEGVDDNAPLMFEHEGREWPLAQAFDAARLVIEQKCDEVETLQEALNEAHEDAKKHGRLVEAITIRERRRRVSDYVNELMEQAGLPEAARAKVGPILKEEADPQAVLRKFRQLTSLLSESAQAGGAGKAAAVPVTPKVTPKAIRESSQRETIPESLGTTLASRLEEENKSAARLVEDAPDLAGHLTESQKEGLALTGSIMESLRIPRSNDVTNGLPA